MDVMGKQRVAVPDSLRSLYSPVSKELGQVEDFLHQELSSDNPFVDSLVKHGFRLGGKRLRPALVLLSAQLTGMVRSEHIRLAAMVELIHTATLVHDDVLDEATLRRHLDTVNARWDNETSVLLGDYLFAKSICLASSFDDAFACRILGSSAKHMCEGEFKQIQSRGDYNLTEGDYFEIISGKTAALTACCCRLGAHYAGASSEACDVLARYGHDLGMAFQIADDVLDLSGDESTVGKSLGTDLVKQKATLPLIHVLDVVQPEERAKLLAVLAENAAPDRHALRTWLDRYKAIEHAEEKARWFAQQAAKELVVLGESPAKNALLALTEFVVNRKQ